MGIRLKHIVYTITQKCTSRCRHCGIFGSSKHSQVMSIETVEKTLKEHDKPIEYVWISGGDPFLYYDLSCEIIRLCRKYGVAKIGIVTNGWWAKSVDYATKLLQKMKELGLTWFSVSLDEYHAEYINPKLPKNALIAATKVGFEDISSGKCMHPSQKIQFQHKNHEKYLKIYNELYNSYSDKIRFYDDSIDFYGRCTENLVELCEKKYMPSGKCYGPTHLEGNLSEPLGVEIAPNGDVMVCLGISIGNVTRESFKVILDRYEYEENPIISVIVEKGPIGLMELLQEKAKVEIPKYFVDECHLCFYLRRLLLPYYPDILRPLSYYFEPEMEVDKNGNK